MSKPLNIVILAAGQGKRMNSQLPKVLHPISQKPMLCHVIDTALELKPEQLIIVYGHGGEQVQARINQEYGNQISWALQSAQLGTGHAVQCALPALDPEGITLVLYGDVPLISAQTLTAMLNKYADNLVMLTDEVDNPHGYGRVVRDTEFAICRIVEEKDTTQGEKAIREINTGFYLLPNQFLHSYLSQLSNANAQGEYYLTDLIEMAYSAGVEIAYVKSPHHYEVMGVNNKLQLEQLERVFQLKQANRLLEHGVTLLDKHRIDIRGTLAAGQDCVIDVNCIFSGTVKLGNNVSIGAGCILTNVEIGDNVVIKPNSIIEDSFIHSHAEVGPFARLRQNAVLHSGSKVGNFVEIKKSEVGAGSKVSHLTYIGDAKLGSQVNVGAGTVTCNYDGKHKYQTTIGDNAFIGSGTMLVAPVTINNGSLIGAGSVITKDTPANELTLARARQVTIPGYLAKKHK